MRKLKKFFLQAMLTIGALLPQGFSDARAVRTHDAPFNSGFAIEPQCNHSSVAYFNLATTPIEDKFTTWVKAARKEAIAKGISEETVNKALPPGMRPIERVLELDQKQPEKTRTYEEYLDLVINDTRVKNGQDRIATHNTLLDNVSNSYGVEKEVIVALWGLETNFGSNTGGFDVIPALATLAYGTERKDPAERDKRRAFFRDEMFKAIRIVDEGHITLEQMKGSWAGAMGQCQFMPSSFYNMAQDYDHDGHKDIWTNHSDIFASAANYISKSGWKKGQPWGEAVIVPANFDRDLQGKKVVKTVKEWQALGIQLKSGSKNFAMPLTAQASIIQPDGAGTKAFIIYDNYRVFLKWNNSNYFASSVGLLSGKLKTGS